jgi:hypothetical protein
MFFGRRSKEKDTQEGNSKAEKNCTAPTAGTAPFAEAQEPEPVSSALSAGLGSTIRAERRFAARQVLPPSAR